MNLINSYTGFTGRPTDLFTPSGLKQRPIMHQSRLTCNQEGAAPRPGLVGDVTGVLAVALPVQSSNQVAGVITLVAELSDREEAGAELPLVPQEARRVSSQQAAGEAERPAESLTDLCVHRLHDGGDCWRRRDRKYETIRQERQIPKS